jgi:hypothetical protein
VSVVIALTVAEFTSRAAIIAALAVLALVAAGWRQTARATSRPPRGPLAALGIRRPGGGPTGTPVERLPVEAHRPPSVLRRLAALVTTGAIAVTSGAVLAIVLAFAAVLAVIGLTDLLGR